MSPLQLKESYYTQLSLDFNSASIQEPDSQGMVEFAVAVQPQLKVMRSAEHPNLFRAELSLQTEAENHTHPLNLALQLVGIFEVDLEQFAGLPTEEQEGKAFIQVRLNGGAMLYSACREYVRMVASRFPYGQDFQLPTISPKEAFMPE